MSSCCRRTWKLPDEGIPLLTRLGLKKNPRLRVLVQASWIPFDGQGGVFKDGAFANKEVANVFKNTMRDAVTAEGVRRMRDAHHGGWLKQLEAQVTALNAALSKECVFIVPASAAVFTLRERVAEGQVPGLARQSEMFRDDHGHPSEVTELLVSYCHFAAIYRRTPVGLPVPEQIRNMPHAAELNALLQQIAWDAVRGQPLSGVK